MSDTNNTGPHHASPPPSGDGDGERGRRLPPPAFPPGSRRQSMRRSPDGDLEDAFISPDDPMPERSGVPDDAFISPDDPFEGLGEDVMFISPDEPIPHRPPRELALAAEVDDFDPDDVVVTGIGDDPHLDPDELALGGDPHVLELIEQVGKLASALRHRGEAGLRTTPGMSRFEVTLRAYCLGFLAGRRAEAGQD